MYGAMGSGKWPGWLVRERMFAMCPQYVHMADIRQWAPSVKSFVWIDIIKYVPQKKY